MWPPQASNKMKQGTVCAEISLIKIPSSEACAVQAFARVRDGSRRSTGQAASQQIGNDDAGAFSRRGVGFRGVPESPGAKQSEVADHRMRTDSLERSSNGALPIFTNFQVGRFETGFSVSSADLFIKSLPTKYTPLTADSGECLYTFHQSSCET